MEMLFLLLVFHDDLAFEEFRAGQEDPAFQLQHTKYGYKYKTYTSNFVRIDNLKVEWFDCKHNMFKGMPMSGRSLEEEYTKWKNQRKSYEDNTILETKTQTTK